MSENYTIKYNVKAEDNFSGTFAKIDKSIDDAAETLEAFGDIGKVAAGAGVALTGGLSGLVYHAANFESAMSKVEAVSGASGKEMDLLNDIAREMGASTSFSASEAADGLYYMALAGWDTQQMLGGLEPILHLAEAGALDLGRSSDLVTDSMSALGLEVNELEGYLDKVSAASSNSNTDIDALMEAMTIAGGTFRRFNVPLDEANAFLGVLANRGTKGTQAGTALNAIMDRMTSGTGQAATGLEELGVSAFDSEGNFKGMEAVMYEVKDALEELDEEERSHIQSMIAGLNHGKSFDKMLNGLDEEYQDLKGSIGDSDGALRDMRDTMKDNLMGDLENLRSALSEMAMSIGDQLIPIAEKLVGYLQSLVDWFNGLSDSTKKIIAYAGAAAAAFLVIGGALLIFVSFLPQIITLFNGFMTVLKIARVALLAFASIPGLIIAAIIGLAVLIYKYWDEIKEYTIAAWGAISEFFSELWTVIKEALIAAWQSIAEFFVGLWESITETASAAWQGFVEIVMSIVQPFIDGIMNLYNGMKDGLSEIMEGISEFFEGIWTVIKNIFLGAVLLILNAVTGDFEELKSNAIAIFENIMEALGDIWEGIKKIFSGALDAIWGFIKAAWENVKSNTRAAMNWVSDTISNIWDGIKRFFTQTLSDIWRTVRQKFNDVVNAVRDKMRDAKKRIETAWDSAVRFLKGIDLRQIGKDIIQGLINGIKDKVTAVANAVKDVTDAITGKIKSILNISSPSRLMKKFGEWAGIGLASGIEGEKRTVERSSERLAQAAAPSVDLTYSTPSGLRSSLSSAISGTVNVNSRDSMLAAAIASLERKLTDLRVEMDERIVGRIVEPHVTDQQERDKRIKKSFA